MYQSDINAIYEGNPDHKHDGLILFSKYRRIANVINELQQFQLQPYSYRRVDPIAVRPLAFSTVQMAGRALIGHHPGGQLLAMGRRCGVQEYLEGASFTVLSEDACHERSLEIEPRQPAGVRQSQRIG